MSETPEWYVTEYPVEGSFAVTDGYKIFAQIIGGKTVGDECDLASRIAKLPDLERERDEAREIAQQLINIASHCIGWHENANPETITEAIKRWNASTKK